MILPFDIKYRPQIESGEYKVFSHEHEEQEARIVCWDNKGEYPIVALVDNEPEKFDKYGRVPGGNRGGEFSLFIVTQEPELTEFEDRVKQLMGCYPNATRENKGSLIYEVRKATAELLELARKELRDEIEFRGEEYQTGYKDGKSEAEKDLPVWKKCGKDTVRTFGDEHLEYRCGCGYLVMNRREILLSDIEKLPGFKEKK